MANRSSISKEPLECLIQWPPGWCHDENKIWDDVASLGLRDLLMTAKQRATIDYLSDGRLLPAFGLGSNRSRDWVATGTATKARAMNEALEIMTRLLAGEEVTFSGKHFQYDKAHYFSGARSTTTAIMDWWKFGSGHREIGKVWNGGKQHLTRPKRLGWSSRKYCMQLSVIADHGYDHFSAGFGVRLGSWEDEPVKKMAEDFETDRKRGFKGNCGRQWRSNSRTNTIVC